eukprot:UN10572
MMKQGNDGDVDVNVVDENGNIIEHHQVAANGASSSPNGSSLARRLVALIERKWGDLKDCTLSPTCFNDRHKSYGVKFTSTTYYDSNPINGMDTSNNNEQQQQQQQQMDE